MTELRVPGDGVPLVKARLEGFFGAAVRVADEVPEDWRLRDDPPLLTVHDDGGPVVWPVMGRPTIRVTAYANGKQTAKQLRGKAMGALMATPVPGIANLHSTGIGYTEARDEDTGADVASFTVTATVRTEVITV